MENEIKNIDDLFSAKLGGAEIEPGSDLTRRFMHRLERKEFVRFNVNRLNIWYLGAAIVVAGTVILLTSPGRSDKTGQTIPQPVTVAPYDSTANIVSDTAVTGSYDTLITAEPENMTTPKGNRVKHDHSEVKMVHETPVTSPCGESDSRTVVSLTDTGTPDGSALLISRINASASEGCVPLHVRFENAASPGAECSWTFGDGGTSDEENPEWVFNVAGTYKITLTVTGSTGHSAFSSFIINVWPKPEAAFDILPSDPSIPGDEISFINHSSGASSYIWHFGDGGTSTLGAPAHQYSKYGKYNVSLVAISDFGCRDSLAITDAFSDTECYIRFPNAFTPNVGGPTGGYYNRLTDNTNMVFHPVCSGVIKYNLKIYSKQGYLVFESDEINMGWDGYYKGQLCSSGVYIWKAEGKFRNGDEYILSGDVTLVNY